MKLYRPATILVGILFVMLGGLTRLADPDQVYDKSNLVVQRGTIGEKIPYGDSVVEVTRMKFASAYLEDGSSEDDKPVDTNGAFVALEWDTTRGTKSPGSLRPTLTTDGGSVYTPIGGTSGDGVSFAQPGFGTTGAVVFEVNPADLKGLTLNLAPTQLYNVLAETVEVDLGVPSEAVAQKLVDGATPQYVIPKSVQRVAQ